MLISNVNTADLIILAMLFNMNEKAEEDTYEINGLSFLEEAQKFDQEKDAPAVIDKWSKDKWILTNEETGEKSFNAIHELIFRTLLYPDRSFACSSDDGRFWGIYMVHSTIVLMYNAANEEQATSEVAGEAAGEVQATSEVAYDICWVPVLPHALGSFYGFYRRVFDKETTDDRTINCSYLDKGNSKSGKLTRTKGGVFSFQDFELISGEHTFKEAFDALTMWIAQAHADSIREELENGNIQS